MNVCDQPNTLDRIEDKIDKLTDMHTDMKVDVSLIKKDVAINTKDLTEHKEGVVQNRVRIEKLEEPKKLMVLLGKTVAWLSGIAGAGYGFYKFLGI